MAAVAGLAVGEAVRGRGGGAGAGGDLGVLALAEQGPDLVRFQQAGQAEEVLFLRQSRPPWRCRTPRRRTAPGRSARTR